jgi:hypothetical protein
MASLGYYRRFSNNRRFGKAIKALGGSLDSLTGSLVGTLRRQPLARLLLVVYLLCIHGFVYVLIGRMQRASMRHDGAVGLAGGRQ